MNAAKRAAWALALALALALPIAGVATAAAARAPAAAADYARAPSELFARFDADGDGRITEREYVDYLALGFRARDRDGNGVLEADELPPGTRPLPRSDSDARLRRQFSRQDANRDNALDATELLAPPRG